jgi:hypothetical protein
MVLSEGQNRRAMERQIAERDRLRQQDRDWQREDLEERREFERQLREQSLEGAQGSIDWHAAMIDRLREQAREPLSDDERGQMQAQARQMVMGDSKKRPTSDQLAEIERMAFDLEQQVMMQRMQSIQPHIDFHFRSMANLIQTTGLQPTLPSWQVGDSVKQNIEDMTGIDIDNPLAEQVGGEVAQQVGGEVGEEVDEVDEVMPAERRYGGPDEFGQAGNVVDALGAVPEGLGHVMGARDRLAHEVFRQTFGDRSIDWLQKIGEPLRNLDQRATQWFDRSDLPPVPEPTPEQRRTLRSPQQMRWTPPSPRGGSPSDPSRPPPPSGGATPY